MEVLTVFDLIINLFCGKQTSVTELKETSTLKANGRLIVGNTAYFSQISVESPAMRYQCQAKQNLPRVVILDYMTSYRCLIVSHKRCSASQH